METYHRKVARRQLPSLQIINKKKDDAIGLIDAEFANT